MMKSIYFPVYWKWCTVLSEPYHIKYLPWGIQQYHQRSSVLTWSNWNSFYVFVAITAIFHYCFELHGFLIQKFHCYLSLFFWLKVDMFCFISFLLTVWINWSYPKIVRYLKHTDLWWLRTQLYRADENWDPHVCNECLINERSVVLERKVNKANKVVVLQGLGLLDERKNKASSNPVTVSIWRI